MIRALVFLLGCVCAAAAMADRVDTTELKVFTLKHQSAETLIPVLRPLLSPEGAISGRNDQLLVRDRPEYLAQIAKAVAHLDMPARQLHIRIHYAGTGEPPPGSSEGQIVRRYSTPGGNLGGVGGEVSDQFVTVLDGHTAFVQVGRDLTDVHYFLELARDRVAMAPDVHYRSVTTGFAVTPHLHQEGVELEVTPQLAFTTNRGQREVVFHRLATRVQGRLGRWIRLGGSDERPDDPVGRGILRHWSTDSAESRTLWLKVEKNTDP